ncbi:MAG: hypothetical protein OEZ06_24205 [Myxococcales bacterium]|nr:hypothetical protein [Myxococcales bacterium]
MGEPGHNPPYDGPIEDMFAYALAKHVSDSVVIHPQFEVSTRAGTFHIDFVLQRDSTLVGIECDEQEFHDMDRDEWRDAIILRTGKLSAMYRFAGADLYDCIDPCLGLVAQSERWAFSERGLLNLETLTRFDPHLVEDDGHDEVIFLGPVIATRRRRTAFCSKVEPLWTRYAYFAEALPPRPLDDLIKAYEALQPFEP